MTACIILEESDASFGPLSIDARNSPFDRNKFVDRSAANVAYSHAHSQVRCHPSFIDAHRYEIINNLPMVRLKAEAVDYLDVSAGCQECFGQVSGRVRHNRDCRCAS